MTCKSIVLHMGMDKTGSTSIRSALGRHLDDPAFHFVRPGVLNAGRILAAAFRDDPRTFHYYRRLNLAQSEVAGLRAGAKRAIEAELAKAVGRIAVLSGEAVSTFNLAECRRMRDFLLQFAPVVRVVGYVRRPKGYMESGFQQTLKAGRPANFEPTALLPDYRRRFEAIDEAFGQDRVDLWLYDPANFTGGDVTLDFCSRLGIRFDPAHSVRHNASLSRDAVALLYAYRKFEPAQPDGPGSHEANELLIARLRRLTGPRLRLHSGLMSRAIEARRPGIEWMERRLNCSMVETTGPEDGDAVASEADLLRFLPAAATWLWAQLGRPALSEDATPSPAEVAAAMGALQRRLARPPRPGP